MPQEMNVLRCYSCQMFQPIFVIIKTEFHNMLIELCTKCLKTLKAAVALNFSRYEIPCLKNYQVHIVKKLKKWQCKICNEKQSIKNVFYQGTGQDCRLQVQYLNFTEHSGKRNSFESLNTTDDAGKSVSSMGSVERPAIANSKWTKYLGAYEEECDQNNRGIVLSNANLTSRENNPHAGFVDQEETNGSSSITNYIDEISTAEVSSIQNEGLSGFVEGSSQPSDIIVHSNFENVSFVREKRVREEENGHSLLSSGCCSPGSSEETRRETTFLPKNIKRKCHGENVTFQCGSETPCKTVEKQPKLDDECSFMKKRLRDIVVRNRSKIGKSTETMVNNSSMVENGEPVSKEIGRLHNLNIYPDISETSGKKKTIFESDCTEFDEIADLL